MQFAVQIIVEADNLKQAISKIPDDLGEVISATPRPSQPQQPQIRTSGGSVSGSPTK